MRRWPALGGVLAVWLLATLAGAQAPAGQPAGAAAASGIQPWWASPAVGLGPLAHSSGSPASVFRMGYLPEAPTLLRKGQWELHSQVDWANFFCDGGDRYFLDYESVRLLLGTQYGLTPRTQVGVGLAVSYQGGGILDGFIEGFESAVGASNEDRLRAPRDRYLVRWRDRDGSVHEINRGEGGWHFDAVGLHVMHQLMEGSETRPSLVVTGVARFPIAASVPGRPAGGVDVGGSLGVGQRLGRFNLYGGLGLVVFGNSGTPGADLLRYQVTLSTALEYRKTPRTSYLLQTLISGPVARHTGELSKRVREVAVGFKHRLGRTVLFELSVGENVLLFSNSADIDFHGGLVWRL
jgi:hypothetical protein